MANVEGGVFRVGTGARDGCSSGHHAGVGAVNGCHVMMETVVTVLTVIAANTIKKVYQCIKVSYFRLHKLKCQHQNGLSRWNQFHVDPLLTAA